MIIKIKIFIVVFLFIVLNIDNLKAQSLINLYDYSKLKSNNGEQLLEQKEQDLKLVVTLEVFTSVGQKVMELVNGQQSAGYHTATFDASGLSSGVYLYKLTTPSFTQTKKMLLIK